MPWSNGVGWGDRSGWDTPPAAGGGGGGSFAKWDATDFIVADTFGNARVSLDATKLIATEFNSSGGSVVIGADRAVSGQCRFEITTNNSGVSVGLELAVHKSDGAGAGLFGGGGGLDWLPDGRVFIGFALQATVASYAPGDRLGIEVDMTAKLAYFVVNSGTRSAGVDISGMSGALYPAADLGPTNANNAVLNAGPTWNTTAASGYGPIP